MRAGGWNREKKGVKRPSVSTEGSNHGGGGSAKRTPEEGLLVPSDVPDGLTNINGSEIAAQFENSEDYRHLCCMSEGFDPSDYSFVVKRRGASAKPWRWEIYRAGRSGPVECSPGFFETMAEAAKEGKKALARFLAKQAA
jgi:hypothetical protein